MTPSKNSSAQAGGQKRRGVGKMNFCPPHSKTAPVKQGGFCIPSCFLNQIASIAEGGLGVIL